MVKDIKKSEQTLKALAVEINDYLAKFKDQEGKNPNPIHVGFMIQKYCEQYINYNN